MAEKESVILEIASKNDFVVLNRTLFLFIVISAVLSPYPFVLTVLVLLLFTAAWLTRLLSFHKENDLDMTLEVFADGRATLIPGSGSMVEGVLDDQQWCTQQIAVLRFIKDGNTRRLIILPSQQPSVGDYRRLTMRLRHGFHTPPTASSML